jgi:ABC-type phosphate transport system substrate-binding protein
MTRPRASYVRLLIRVAVYVLVIVVLFRLRDRIDFKRLVQQVTGPSAADTTLVLAGSDLAPTLVDQLVTNYRRDYPKLEIRVGGGHTTAALQELVNNRADAVFLSRPPLLSEQRLFLKASGDTALWYPIALGATLVLSGADGADSTVTLDALRSLAGGMPAAGRERLYVPDPNTGLWDAVLAKLGLPPAADSPPHGVIFLKDDAAVADAVHADPAALGLASAFALPDGVAAHGARALSLRASSSAPPNPPGVVQVASGDYPLWSYLYIGCRPRGGVQGAKFVTHLTSPRGQRQIARTEFLPVQQVMREIYLNRNPGHVSPSGHEEGTG